MSLTTAVSQSFESSCSCSQTGFFCSILSHNFILVLESTLLEFVIPCVLIYKKDFPINLIWLNPILSSWISSLLEFFSIEFEKNIPSSGLLGAVYFKFTPKITHTFPSTSIDWQKRKKLAQEYSQALDIRFYCGFKTCSKLYIKLEGVNDYPSTTYISWLLNWYSSIRVVEELLVSIDNMIN